MIGIISVVLLVLGMAGFALHHEWQVERSRAEAASQQMASRVAQAVAAVMEKTAAQLRTAIQEAESELVQGQMNTQALSRLLNRHRAQLPEFSTLRVADANGRIIFGAEGGAEPLVNIADRVHFNLARSDPKSGLMVGEAAVSRITKKPTIYFAQRFNNPDGTVAGVVTAGVETAYVQSMFAGLDPESRWALALRTESLKLIVRHPSWDGFVADQHGSDVSQVLRGAVANHPDSGTVVSTNPIDNVERVASYVRVGTFPFYVVAGVALEEYRNRWQQRALQILGVACFVIVVAAGFLSRNR